MRAVALAVMAGSSAVATAGAQTVLVTNLAEPTRAVTGISDTLWAAQSFATDASSWSLASIDVLLRQWLPAPTVVAQLRADVGGAPGATLAAFALGAVPTGAPAPVTLTPGSLVPLAPSTMYWLVLGTATADSLGWAYAIGNATTGPGTLGAYGYSGDLGATWGAYGTDNPYHVRVNVVPTAVPEPGTLGLAALGLGVLLAGVRRARPARRPG